jgi:drug/metabolite transporter (DMT)-like permease
LLGLPDGNFVIRATTILAVTLGIQSALMAAWLVLRDRRALRGILAGWRVSLGAGFLGAFASLFWFIGFALTPAANVRTLALVEVVMAQALSGRLFRQTIRPLQLAGMGLILVGVGWLLAIA